MANNRYTVGATAVLDGEREYKQALGEINAGLRVNYSEMQLVAAQYDKAGDAQKALFEKTNALNGAIIAQTEKVGLMEKALAESVKKYGESDRRTLEWRTSLNKAETDLVKLNGKMADYQQQLEKSSTSTESLGGVIRNLSQEMGVNLPPMAEKAIERLDGINASAAALVGVIGAAIFKLGDMTVETAKLADDLLTLSSTTGLSTDALQEFEYAAELIDVSSETMQGSMTKMIKSMQGAKQGTKAQADAFDELRVKYQQGANGELRDAETVFYELVDALGKVKNETERDALSMQIFGRSARELNPLIELGSKGLQQYKDEAHALGYIIDNETLQSFGLLEDGMQRFDKQQDALYRTLSEALLPVITSFFEIVNSIPTPVLTGVIVMGGLVAVMTLMYKTITSITTANKLRAAANLILSGSNVALTGTNTTLAGTNAAVAGTNMAVGSSFASLLPIILGVIAVIGILIGLFSLFSGKAGEVKSVTAGVGQEMQQLSSMVDGQMQQGQYKAMNYNGVPRNFKGTNYHPGGPTIINDDPDGRYGEIVDLPTGSRIYPAGKNPGGDTFVLQVQLDQVGEVQRLLNVVEQLKSDRRRR